jgi:probable lipoprotein NlpC
MDRRGLDCSGFIYLSFRDALAVEVPRTVRTLYGWVEKIPDKQLRPGDLVFFRTAGAAAGVSHAGIYTGDGRFIHAASDGPVTGVIYSRLSEAYWQRTYAGAGRALPEGTGPVLADGGDRAGGGDRADAGDRAPGGDRASGGDRARGPLIGAALALSWNTFPEAGSPLRGASLEVRGAYDIGSGDDGLRLGLELRPQWDGTLGVFRLPLTLSLGFGDIIRVFAGPALTLGDPVLPTAGGDRRYTGGSAWFGTFGVMTAPFSVSLGRGALSLYGEIAWESFRREPSLEEHGDADLGAALRVSLGLRYTWGL